MDCVVVLAVVVGLVVALVVGTGFIDVVSV